MRYIDPHLLHTFIVLADCGQFTKAADLVGLSQSAVSQQVQKLEALLDVPLINRTKRRVQLTSQGEVFLDKAKTLLLHHEALITDFNQTKLSGRIRFGSPEDFASIYLPGILSRFTKIYPNIQLEVQCDLTLNLLNAFERGEHDLIVFKEEQGQNHQGALPLWKEPLVWVYDKDFPIDEALEQGFLRLVLSPQPCVYRHRATHSLDELGIGWEQVYTSQSLAGALAAVRGGLGVTVLPLTSVPNDLRTTALDKQTALPPLETTEIKLLTVKSPTPIIKTFQQFIQDSLAHTH